MSLDDLDLEFEDEEAEKKSDAVAMDVDLEFGTDTNVTIPRPQSTGQAKPMPKPSIVAKASPPVQAPVAKPQTQSNIRPITPKTQAPVMGSSALKVEPTAVESVEKEDQSDLVTELKGKIEKIEVESQIKIAVAEFKTDILSDLLSDIKLLEHQIGGLLNRIHSKHPDVKQEALMIKKLLADFSTKKRK